MPPKPPSLSSSSRLMPRITVSAHRLREPTSVVPIFTPVAQRIVGAAGRPAERLLEIGRRSRRARPAPTSRSACSSSSARCTLTTTRHFLRSMRLAVLAPRSSSAIFHWLASASGPPGRPAPIDSTPSAVLARRDHAERRDGAGHRDLEMRVGVGRQVQPRLAHLEPVGLHRHRLVARKQPHDGVHRLLHARPLRRPARCPACRRPTVSAPGPQPSIARPRVMWSSCTKRCATMNGWWYGRLVTPGAQLDVLRALRRGGDDQSPARR